MKAWRLFYEFFPLAEVMRGGAEFAGGGWFRAGESVKVADVRLKGGVVGCCAVLQVGDDFGMLRGEVGGFAGIGFRSSWLSTGSWAIKPIAMKMSSIPRLRPT